MDLEKIRKLVAKIINATPIDITSKISTYDLAIECFALCDKVERLEKLYAFWKCCCLSGEKPSKATLAELEEDGTSSSD